MILEEKIKHDFNQYLSGLNGESQSSLAKLQKQAFEVFEKNGIPTTKNEEWKYTSLKTIADKELYTLLETKTDARKLIASSVLNEIVSNRLVFVNGRFLPELSSILETDSTIIISNLLSARKEHAAIIEKHLGKYAKPEDGLNAMNTALLNDGAFVYVPQGKFLQFPLMITSITDANEANVLSQPRNLIVLEKSSEAHIIENYVSTCNNYSFTNIVNEVYVGENATLEHYKIQRQCGESYHNNYTQFFQEANTNVNQVTLTLDGMMVRNNLHFYMNGSNCNSLLYGLYITDGKKHVDNHTRVDHAMPNCYSDEKYKGILKDRSTAVFNGKIMVHLDAQKTNAYQRNQNILLSEEATVNTKPQLEIFADDVKCTHGATIGTLDEEPMFYLRSRGIPEDAARKILLNAYADEIAERIKIPELVQILEEQIEKKL